MTWKRQQLARTTEALRAATTYMFGEPIIPTDGAYAGRLFIGDGVTLGGKLASSSATVLDFNALGADTTIASAATTDLSTLPTARGLITGTTGITSFGNGQNEFRLIRFAGVLTITPGANLAVPGGQAITTQANDTAVLTSDGSSPAVWRIRHYQRADGTPLAPFSGAVRADAAQALTAAQQAQARANILATGNLVNVQTFMASGTYTRSANVSSTVVEVIGGGGGGGGVVAGTGSAYAVGAGGGGGGYALRRVAPAATVGAGGTAGATTGTIGGTGGTSSFGTWASATGGVGGAGQNSAATSQGNFGTLGGAGGDGTAAGGITISGSPGHGSIYAVSPVILLSGAGGAAARGGGGGKSILTTGAGNPGVSYGGGGSGAASFSTTANAGGAGAAGLVIVWEYA
jgi:hypothetical protein